VVVFDVAIAICFKQTNGTHARTRAQTHTHTKPVC